MLDMLSSYPVEEAGDGKGDLAGFAVVGEGRHLIIASASEGSSNASWEASQGHYWEQ